jgi:hypothetical protein
MDKHTEDRIGELEPHVGEKALRFVHLCNCEGIDARVTQSLRSWNMQAALYAQGREDLQAVNEKRAAVRLAPITAAENVERTKAAPGHGWHEFALAFDVCPFDQFGRPDWNEEHPAWKRMIEIGESIGLKSGTTFRTFPDGPHFEYTGVFDSTPSDYVRDLYKQGGTIAVWAEAFPEKKAEAAPAPAAEPELQTLADWTPPESA